MTDRTKEWAPRGNLHELRADVYRGHLIVPILGAGLSIGAGIPIGTQITHYMRAVAQLLQLGDADQLRDRLRTRGWPRGHELEPTLPSSWLSGHSVKPAASAAANRGARSLFGIAARANGNGASRRLPEPADLLRSGARQLATYLGDWSARSLRAGGQQAMPEWIRLLDEIAGGQQRLVDSFFDGLVRGKTPATAHQFVAYLTRRLGTPLIFTTNFDDLIENALHDEGLTPVVYEIVKGAAPDDALVKRHLSIIKLHGGKFELLAGKALASPHAQPSLRTYANYAPATAQILVVGQREEPRVISLVEELLALNPQRRVTWVYHAPSQPEGPELPPGLRHKVCPVPCTDARLFLQELYQRLFWSHPAGQLPYRALFQVPEVVVRKPDTDGSVTRTLLSFNLYEFASFPAFLSSWTEQLKPHVDPLPPLLLSPSVAFRGLHYPGRPGLEPIWIRYIAECLRRHPFDITIDLLSAFSSRHPAHQFEGEDASSSLDSDQIKAFARFIEALKAEKLGQSRIRLLASELESDGLSPAEKFLRQELLQPDHEATHKPDHEAIQVENALRSQGRGADARQWARSLIDDLNRAAKEPEPKNASTAQLDAWKERVEQARWRSNLTRVACAFRRPRPLVALIRIACHAHPQGVDLGDPHARVIGQIEEALAWLVHRDREVLLEPDWSSTYSMIEDRRNALFEAFRNENVGLSNDIQHEIAQYYRCDLYAQSGDCAALVEYLFHRLASADVPHSLPDHAERRRKRLAWLFGTIARERLDFVGRGQASVLLDVFKYLEWSLRNESKRDKDEARWLRARARELEAEVLKDTLDIKNCREIYQEELHDRMNEHPSPGTSDPDSAGAPAPAWPSLHFVDDLRLAEVRIALGECGTVATDPFPSADSALDVKQPFKLEAESRQHLAEAQKLIDRIEKAQRQATGSGSTGPGSPFARALEPFAARLAAVRARLAASQIELAHMAQHAWESCLDGGAQRLPDAVVSLHDMLFNAAIDELAEHPNEEGVDEIRCRLRCSYARTLYLAGRWRAADKELNRALAFNTKRHKPESLLSRAIYQLHRAEYALLRARDEEDLARVFALLNASITSLAHGRRLLDRSRCNVLWWGRSFILTARANTEMLRVLLGADHLRRRGSDAMPSELALAGRYLWKSIRDHALGTHVPENVRYPGPFELDGEMLALGALHAICGGLNNTLGESMQASLHRVWDELRVLWSTVHERGTDDAPSIANAASRWRSLNHCAGLGWYESERFTAGLAPAESAAVETAMSPHGTRADAVEATECDVALAVEPLRDMPGPLALDLPNPDGRAPSLMAALTPQGARAVLSADDERGPATSPQQSAARRRLLGLLGGFFSWKRTASSPRIIPSVHVGAPSTSSEGDRPKA